MHSSCTWATATIAANDWQRPQPATTLWLGVRDALLGQQLPPDCSRLADSALDSATASDASFSHSAVLGLLSPTDDDQMIGRLGTYEVVGVIGSGGMGVVLKAFDAALNR